MNNDLFLAKSTRCSKPLFKVAIKTSEIRWLSVVIALAICGMDHLAAREFYVSTLGNDAASGTSSNTPWRHCAYAASQAVAGDTVYIKAGNYSGEQIVFSQNGSAQSPIVFAGYNNAPGDASAAGRANAVGFPSTALPLLDGISPTSGIAINLTNRKYIIVKNIQLRNYEIGIYAYGAENVQVDNIAGAMFGDINLSYNGAGISFGSYGNYNSLTNCSIYNACAESFSVIGDGNRLVNCHAVSDNNITGVNSATDYYIIVTGNDNVLEQCEVERIGNLGHLGHGIGFKYNCTRNRVSDCRAINLGSGFYARHRAASGNLFERCRSVSGENGFVVRDGASDNQFNACEANGCSSAIAFFDTSEDDGAQYAGRRNVFANCLFTNSRTAVIDFDPYDQATVADDNSFVNCTISGGPALFWAGRINRNNRFLNCIITDIVSFQSDVFAVDAPMQYCDIWNCGFATPVGLGNFSANPLFYWPSQGDYHLQSTAGRWNLAAQSWAYDAANSPCINTGNPASAFNLEPMPNGGRINLGRYGNTTEASRSGSGPINTTPSISVSPTNVVAGGQISVTVSGGPGNAADWVGLFDAATPLGGAEISGFWLYLNGTKNAPAIGSTSATFNFAMPMTTGNYQFRFQPNNNYTPVLAMSGPIVVSSLGNTSQHFEAENYLAQVGTQLFQTGDTGGGNAVAYFDAGDTLDYSVTVSSTGSYSFDFRLASAISGSQFQLKENTIVLATINPPTTGGWDTWQTVNVPNINLAAGNHILRINTVSGGFNFNWFKVTNGTAATPPVTAFNQRFQAESFAAMAGIVVEPTTDSGGGSNIGYVDAGDSMDYNVTVPTAGNYKFDFRIASPFAGKAIQLKKGTTVLTTLSVPNTGNWQVYQTLSATNIPLSAGTNTLRITTATGGWNFNWFNISK